MAAVDAWVHAKLGASWRIGSSPPSQVKRCLFGPIDHEETKRFLKDEIGKQNQEDNQRWNFDFVNEVPLPDTGKGDIRYQWSPLRTDADAALPEMRQIEDTRPEEDSTEHGGDADTSKETSSEVKAQNLGTRQTHIPDFMRKRKSSFPANKTRTSPTEPPIKTARRSSA